MRRTLCLPFYPPPRPPRVRQARPFPYRPSPAIGSSALVLVLWCYGDVLLGVALHALYLVIEILELGLEHLLEKLFQLHGHTAQMWTAWIGLGLLLTLGLYAYRRVRRVLTARCPAWPQVRQYAGRWVMAHWDQVSFPVLTLVLSVVLF